jgi:lipoate-protein ligase B
VNGEKIASIGVAIKRWVSFHGFALNYETDLNYFELIHPCGLEGVKMTSMAKVLGKRVSGEDVAVKTKAHFREIFERAWEVKRLEEVLPSQESAIE